MLSTIRKAFVKTNCRLHCNFWGGLNSPLLYKSLLAAIAIVFAVPSASRVEANENSVEAVQYGRSLFIFGDDNNNAIRIGQFDNGDIVVQGIECDGRVTDVNPDSGDDMAVFYDVQNIFVNLGDGNDCIAASNDLWLLSDCLDLGKGYLGEPEVSVDLGESIYISGELEIVTGQGNDEVYIGGFATGHAMQVYTQSGNDDVGICDIYVGTSLLVYTSNGHDQVGIVGFEDLAEDRLNRGGEGPLNYVRYQVLINTGQDNDEVCVESLFTDEGQLKVLTFSGDDDVFIGECNPFTDPDGIGFVDVGTSLTLDTGTGNDEVAISNTLVGLSLIAVLGNGVDDLWIEDARVGRSTIIDTGKQNDDVSINFFITENDLVIHTQQGNDEAAITNSLVGRNLITTLGAGWDDLYIDNIGVSNLTSVNAGSDNDDVYVKDLDTNRLQFFMANGNDELYVSYSTGSYLYADGGSGTDCLDEVGNDFAAENVRSFELDCDD